MKPSYIFFHIRPIIMVIVAPLLILYFTFHSTEDLFSLWYYGGIMIFLAGFCIFLPAHWQVYKPEQWQNNEMKFLSAEPDKLVTSGFYKHIRNPQLLGIYLMLAGEVVFFKSWLLFFYLILVILTSAVVSIRVEEPQLTKRYNDSYMHYKNGVKRFIPLIF